MAWKATLQSIDETVPEQPRITVSFDNPATDPAGHIERVYTVDQADTVQILRNRVRADRDAMNSAGSLVDTIRPLVGTEIN